MIRKDFKKLDGDGTPDCPQKWFYKKNLFHELKGCTSNFAVNTFITMVAFSNKNIQWTLNKHFLRLLICMVKKNQTKDPWV